MIPRYRAWLKEDKEMVDVEEINFFNGGFDFIGDAITWMCKSDDCVLMQSTGLRDMNGKEIFEGDIVDYNGRNAVVKWHGSYASFVYMFVDELRDRNQEWDPLYLSYPHFQVVGNKFETPALLEVGS